MKFVAVILFTIATVTTVVLGNTSENSVDMKLMSFLSRSSNSMQENPQRSIECFEYYVPLLNEIGLKYEEGYKSCLSSAEDAIVAAEEGTAPQREKLADDSSAACAAVSECKDESSAETIFQCYVKSSSDSSRTLHGVSTQATVELATLQENIRRIKSNEGACITQNKIEYERNSVAAYDDFNDCILGISEVPTQKPPTETTTEKETEGTETPEETTKVTETPEETTEATETPEETTKASEETTETTESPETTEENDRMPEEDLRRFIKKMMNVRKLIVHN